jgi:hypothetical protein
MGVLPRARSRIAFIFVHLPQFSTAPFLHNRGTIQTGAMPPAAESERREAMRKYALMVVAVMCLLVAVWAPTANAQITGEINVNVPFAFHVGNTQLPAGRYMIRRVDMSDPDLLEIRSMDGKTAVLFRGRPAQSSSTPSKTELVFKRYGNTAILSQIFQQGIPMGVELPALLQEERAVGGGATPTRQSVEGKSGKSMTK